MYFLFLPDKDKIVMEIYKKRAHLVNIASGLWFADKDNGNFSNNENQFGFSSKWSNNIKIYVNNTEEMLADSQNLLARIEEDVHRRCP